MINNFVQQLKRYPSLKIAAEITNNIITYLFFSALWERLLNDVYMHNLEQNLTLYYIAGKENLTPWESNLVEASMEAAKSSYSPYSGFAVGAAILLENGTVVKGSNQENAASPSGLCAERVAAFSAGASFPGIPLKAIAIFSPDYNDNEYPLIPCGGCLQVLSELEQKQKSEFTILLCSKNNIWKASSTKVFLPFPFKLK